MRGLARGLTLRQDGRRLGLEGAFSGVALGLVLLYLLQDAAAAQGSGAPRRQSPVDDGEAEPARAMGSAAERLALRRLPLGPGQSELPALLALTPLDMAASQPPGGRADPQALVKPQPQLQGTASRLDPDLGRGVPLWQSPWGWGAGPLGFSPEALPTAGETTITPRLLVLLRSDDTLVASTVDGEARLLQQGSQVGIDRAWLDLQASPCSLVLVRSEHTLNALARSVQGVPILLMDQEHLGLRNSTLLLGDGDGITDVEVRESLELAQLGGSSAGSKLHLDLAALQGSRVWDSGGNNVMRLLAYTTVVLPPGLNPSDWQVLLRNRALVGSSLECAGGDQRIEIRSALDLSAPAGPDWQLQAVALEASQLRTGAGDDSVLVQGAILDSWLDLGPGRNSAVLQGPLQGSTLQLSAGSLTQVQLGDQADALQLRADPGVLSLELRAGGGDDRLWLPDAPVRGSLNLWGEAGRDRFVLPSDPRTLGNHLVLADLAWDSSGSALQLSDDLAWANDATPLIPSGLEGLGQAQLLPIAPLEQLLAGMGSLDGRSDALESQLAIATTSSGSQLLWLEPALALATPVASLPALHQL